MPGPEVKIRVLFQSDVAKAAVADFARQSTAASKAVAMEARVAADASLYQARAMETVARSALSASRAQLLNAQASANVAKASQISAASMNAEAVAATKVTAALERKTAAQAKAADRQLVFADNRQNRDMSWMARDQEDVRGRRTQMVSRVADGAMLGGAALLGGLAYAGAEAAKFDTTLTMMRNNTSMTDKEFAAFRDHIIQVGTATGASMDQMAAAFMRAKNHGFDMKESMAVVDAATKSALATGANIEETANVLAQTMHIFHLSGDKATEAMNMLHQAQLQGNTTMEQFVQNFGLAEAVTSKYGLTLQDTAAITATMTMNGLNMAEAGTQIRDVMQHLTNPVKSAREEIERLSAKTGVDLVGDIKKLQSGSGSLTQTMIDLSAATGGQAVSINKIIPAQRGAFGAMALTGKASEDLKKNFSEQGDILSGKLDPSTAGFARQQETLTAKTNRLTNEMTVLGVKLGTAVLPELTEIVTHVTGLVDAFNSLSPATQRTIAEALGWLGALLLVGGTAVKVATGIVAISDALKLAGVSFGAAGEAGVLALGPGAAVVAAVVALGVEIIALKNDWDDVRKAQDQATGSLQRYADQKKNLQGQGELGKLNVNEQEIAATRDKEQDALRAYKLQMGGQFGTPDVSQWANHPGGRFAASEADRMQKNIDGLTRDYNAEKAREKQLVGVGAGDANRQTQTHADQLAPYQIPLLSAVGQFHDASVQCGEFIRRGASAFGMVGSIQSAANAALRGKNLVQSDGVDSHGAPRYPNGTVIYFGHQGAQHFVSTYVNDRGEQKVVENTEAGQGRGRWRVRADRDLSAIAAEYHGQQVAFSLPGVLGPTAGARTNPYKGGTFGGDGPDKSGAAALVEKAGLAADDAKRAYEQATKAFEDTKSVHYLAAAESLRRTQADREIQEAKAGMAKANATKDPETAANAVAFERKRKDILAASEKDIKALQEQAGGTAEDHRKAAADLAINVLKSRVDGASGAVSRLEALVAVSTDPTNADALLAAYKAEAQAQLALLRGTLKHALSDIPNSPGRQGQRQALVSVEQTQEIKTASDLAGKTADVDARRIEAKERLLTLQREQAAAAQAEQDALLAAAQTEAQRLPLRQKLHDLRLNELDLQRQSALLENDAKYAPLLDRATDETRPGIQAESAAAGRRINEGYGTAVNTENVGFGAQERDAANAAITARADRLRTEAGLTDDLTAKMAKLAQAYDLMIRAEPDPAAAGLLRRQKQDEQDRLGLRRDADAAQRSLAGGMVANDPAQITAALDALKALTTDARAGRDEQAAARGEYAGAIKDLTEQLRLSAREGVARLNEERPDMTAGELASATAAAKSILDGMLDRSFTAIDQMHDPRDRKKALDGLKSSVGADPVYRTAGVAGDADRKITERISATLKRSGIVDEFMGELSAGAGRASSDVVKALLNPKDRKNIGKAFWHDIANAAEGALGNAVQKEVTHGLDALLGAGTDALGGLLGKRRNVTPGSLADPSQARASGSSTTGGQLGAITGFLGPLLAKKGGKGEQVVDTMHVANLVVAGTQGKTGVPGTKPGDAASGVSNDISTGLGIASLLAGPLFGAGAAAGVAGASNVFGTIGKIFGFSEGGIVPGPRGAGDIVPAMLSPEEWVIPAAKVRAMRDMGQNLPGSPASAGGQAQTVNYEAHYHQPVFHNAEDVDRENRRNAQRLTTAFTIG